MVNTNIQGVVRLDGPGLRYKPLGDHGPGEYSQFQNVELVDGVIRTRRPIVPVQAGTDYGTGYTAEPLGASMQYFTGFAGYIRNRVVATGITRMFQMGGNDSQKKMYSLFQPTTLPAPPGGHGTETDPKGHWVLGVFNYGDQVYYITHKYEFGVVNELWLQYHAISPFPDAQTSLIPMTEVKILTLPAPGVNDPTPSRPFRTFFIHKDRLFILMRDRLYYSKATDPKVFASPDGGFIDIDSGWFYDAVALSDNIYLTSETKTFAFSYSTDPAKDGYLRPIYTGAKITKMVIHNDVIYASSQDYLYRVTNFNFEPVLEFGKIASYNDDRIYSIRMESFGDSIVIGRGFFSNYSLSNGKWLIENSFTDVLMYNVDSDSVSSIEFKDGFLNNGGYWPGSMCDFAVNQETQVLYIAMMFNTGLSRTFRFYCMNVSRTDQGDDFNEYDTPTSTSGLDKVFLYWNANTVIKARITARVTISNWSPDYSPYLQKRFRTLRILGFLPGEGYNTYPDYKVSVTIDDLSTFSWFTKDMPPSDEPFRYDNPQAYIFRVNQKGRRIKSLSIHNNRWEDDLTAIPDNNNELFLQIQDIRFYYSQSQYPGPSSE